MARPPKLDGDAIRSRLANMDRGVFAEPVARGLEAMPTVDNLKKLAAKSPEAWSRYQRNVSALVGFGDRHEHVHAHLTPEAVAKELVGRFGKDSARILMQTAGLPVELLDRLPETADTPSGKE